MVVNKILGARIKYYREHLDMNQQELAEKVGYKNKASIARIEKGQMELPASKVVDFAKALGIEVPDLIKGLAAEARFELYADQVTELVSQTEPKPDNYLKPIMNLLIKMNDSQLQTTYKMMNKILKEDSNGNSNMVR